MLTCSEHAGLCNRLASDNNKEEQVLQYNTPTADKESQQHCTAQPNHECDGIRQPGATTTYCRCWWHTRRVTYTSHLDSSLSYKIPQATTATHAHTHSSCSVQDAESLICFLSLLYKAPTMLPNYTLFILLYLPSGLMGRCSSTFSTCLTAAMACLTVGFVTEISHSQVGMATSALYTCSSSITARHDTARRNMI